MTIQQRLITDLIRRAVTGEECSVPEEADISALLPLCDNAKLTPLVYAGMKGHPAVSEEVQNDYWTHACQFALYYEKQMDCYDRLCERLNESNLDFLPLKGLVLKDLYPDPSLRAMGDMDILVRTDDYEAVAKHLKALGFEEKEGKKVDIRWDNADNVHIELHKQLFYDFEKEIAEHYRHIWGKAFRTEKCLFSFSKEETFLYLFVHFARHYRNGGIGLRHLTDLWIYRRAYPSMSDNYIRTSLEEMHLLNFYDNVLRTIDVLFGDASIDAVTGAIIDRVMTSGAYGEDALRKTAASARDVKTHNGVAGARLHRGLSAVFPSAQQLGERYPAVQKHPVLTPVFWVVRGVDALFNRPDNIKTNVRRVQEVNGEETGEYLDALKLVGLE